MICYGIFISIPDSRNRVALRNFFTIIAGRREKGDGLYFNTGRYAYTEKKLQTGARNMVPGRNAK